MTESEKEKRRDLERERQEKIVEALRPLSKGQKADGTSIEIPIIVSSKHGIGCPCCDSGHRRKKSRLDQRRY